MTNQQDSQHDSEAILTSITDGFFVLDEAWRVVFSNAQAQRLLRLWDDTGDMHLGENVWEAFPGAVGGDLYRTLRRAVRERITGEAEVYIEPWDQWLGVRAYPFAGGLSVLMTDISGHKETEDELLEALQEATNDTAWFSRSLMERLRQIKAKRTADTVQQAQVTSLTKREKQVLERVARGQNDIQIAAELSLALQTVRNYITHIYSKLGVHSRAEAVVWARERGFGSI